MGDPAGESDQASLKVGLGQLSSYCWSKPTCSSYKVSKQVEYKQLMNWLDFALAEGEEG